MAHTKPYGGSTDHTEHDRWLTIGEAAKHMHLSVSSLRRYDQAGVLPATRTPGGQRRWLTSQLDAWLDSGNSAA